MAFLVVVKFFVFVSEVVSIFSKILTWIFGRAKGYLCPTNSIIGGARPGCPPKSTPMTIIVLLCTWERQQEIQLRHNVSNFESLTEEIELGVIVHGSAWKRQRGCRECWE